MIQSYIIHNEFLNVNNTTAVVFTAMYIIDNQIE
jgi:hypothetical protein